MISENSSTGYLMWDETKKAMVEKAGEWRRKPVEFGVPVTTLVGYYDPQKRKRVISILRCTVATGMFMHRKNHRWAMRGRS